MAKGIGKWVPRNHLLRHRLLAGYLRIDLLLIVNHLVFA